LRIVDVATGHMTQPWKDRAIDQQPVFSPDGRFIYFSSDRSGISNIYAYELGNFKLWQVTNVRVGAFMPEPSSDGKDLHYVGYGSRGYDLYTLAIDEHTFLEAPPAPAARDDRVILDDRGNFPVKRYSALPTLRPRALYVNYASEASGGRLTLSVSGSDVAGLHSISTTAVLEPEGRGPDLYFGYGYGRLPADFYLTAYRITDPNNSYAYGTYAAGIDEIRTGASTGIDIPFPREFDAQSVAVGYAAEKVDAVFPTGLAADPYATVPSMPRRGTSSSLRLSYGYSNVESTTYAVGRERGFSLRLTLEEAHRGLGSELEGTNVAGRIAGYLPLPWARHHVLALAGTAAASTGEAYGGYSLGGYQNADLFGSLVSGVSQSRVSLRGYPSGRFRGRRLLVGNAEYRFPIAIFDRGISTLPLFLRDMGGAFGMDVGSAFDSFDPHAFDKTIHYGFAGELWFDIVLAYRLSTRLVLGYAAGSGEGAYDRGTGYFIVGSAL
jgi:hypothetical protein